MPHNPSSEPVGAVTSIPSETSALLADQPSQHDQRSQHTDICYGGSQEAVLPVAFLAALAMSATAATSLFAYANLLCKIPTDCQESERNLYAGAVAIASCIANVCGLAILGFLEKLSKRNTKAVLVLWLCGRSMSVIMLALGVFLNNILVALSGRIFEGLASDTILHFSLNSFYVQAPNTREVSRLIGVSLALFMIGISISPAVAGLFDNFTNSFSLALGIFAISIIYTLKFVKGGKHSDALANSAQDQHPKTARNGVVGLIKTSLSPFQLFLGDPGALCVALSLFLYNSVQSYVFAATMVHTSINFGFSSKENGLLISLAHITAATYLFCALFALPYAIKKLQSWKSESISERPNIDSGAPNAILALVSLLFQCVSLVLLGLATKIWQVYTITAIFAIGLATPSFIKSYLVNSVPHEQATQAVAALAMMESLGSLLAPIFMGGFQTLWPGQGVFFTGGGVVGISGLLFTFAALARRTKSTAPLEEEDLLTEGQD